MKIAIVCDWLVTFAGAEKFLTEIIFCYPNADLYAVIDFLKESDRKKIFNKYAKTTFIQKMPFAKTKYRSYLPLMPLAIEQIDVSEYDLIISNSHAVAKGVITGPNQTHISCTLSPMRYAWDLQHQYLKETGLDKSFKGYFAKYFLHKLRLWDQRTANGVDNFVAISNYISKRIWKIYRRKSTVIHPPVDTNKFRPHKNKENFYVTASRMVPYKKIDLIVETFSKMPNKKLIVIGDGPDFKKIQKLAGKNIELLGYQSQTILEHYLQRAKAFVFAAEEDYGLLPLEAQSCGTPVIAYGKGGALDTVKGLDDKNPTGVFFQKQNYKSISEAINLFENNSKLITSENCINNAATFSRESFQKQFKELVSNALNG
ncbi:glycosyltransferase family 4 protein [Gammaproteobacteria bacterium]|nr:glycosyltransferase family 4 protein [Gammaproteobacteria bacterium]